MERYFMLDKYNTYADWGLIVTDKEAPQPEPKTNYVELDGANGSLDLTEALTGEVVYNDRTVTAAFWTSEGTRDERNALLKKIAIALHGKKIKIVEPDDPDHYFLGRVKIKAMDNGKRYATFNIEATCEPWRYAINETVREVKPGGSIVDVVINNNGVKTVCPTLTVTGTVGIACGGIGTTLTTGVYQFSAIRLAHGANVVRVSGTGSVTFAYREADL